MASGAGAVFVPASVALTWSWGLQPATALVEWVTATPPGEVVAGAMMAIEVGNYTWYGITDNYVTRTAADGISILQEFQDTRAFLQWDQIYAQFNIPDNRVIGGVYQRRYKHLLPANYNTNGYNWTDTPYTAEQILNFIFGSATVQSPWIRTYHYLMANPVYELDYANGQTLGSCLLDISEKLGLVFTVDGGPYNLFWALKGEGDVPNFPAGSDAQRTGSALSSNPDRYRILGARNVYQIFNCPLQPDWLPAWQEFWDFGAFVDDIFLNGALDTPMLAGAAGAFVAPGTPYRNIPNDPDHVIGYSLAGARARLLTVAQYAAMRDARSDDGNQFRDYRKFQGRSRMNLPVALYLSQLMFRAFRLDDSFNFMGYSGGYLTRFGFDLDNTPVVETTHDPTTGEMLPLLDTFGNYMVPSSQSNGYAIVQGYQVGQDAFGTLNPDYFDYQSWVSSQLLWQYAGFQTDDSGEGDQFILFDDPVINSGDLIGQAGNALPDGRPRGMLNAQPAFTIPPVKATLIMRGEKFSYVQGLGTRDGVENIGSLAGQFLIPDPPPPAVPGQSFGQELIEIPYLDGDLASDKARRYANTLLNGQFYYQNGGYINVTGTDDGVNLSGVVDRVTVHWDAQNGLTKEVDFTNERSRQVSIGFLGRPTLMLEPEREFDRKASLDPLFAGQDTLQQEARQLRLTAAVLRANRSMQRALVDTFHLLLGLDAPPMTVMTDKATDDTAPNLPAGSPLFRTPTANVCTTPNDDPMAMAPAPADPPQVPQFVGVTTMDGENAAAGVRCTATGAGGVVQARVMGPVTPGQTVGLGSSNIGRTYMETGAAVPVGTALETLTDSTVGMIRVRLSQKGGGGFQGEYDETKSYSAGDEFTVLAPRMVGGVMMTPGEYGVPPAGTDRSGRPWAGSVPANPTGNAVPQDPLPALGAAPNDKFYAMLIFSYCEVV